MGAHDGRAIKVESMDIRELEYNTEGLCLNVSIADS
jgi:hypothetical protein